MKFFDFQKFRKFQVHHFIKFINHATLIINLYSYNNYIITKRHKNLRLMSEIFFLYKKKLHYHNFKLFFSFVLYFLLFFSSFFSSFRSRCWFVSIWCRFNVSYNKNLFRDFYWRVNKIKLRRHLFSQQLNVEIVLKWRFNRTRFWRERNQSTKNCHRHKLLR
jgi:hypothetical protein